MNPTEFLIPPWPLAASLAGLLMAAVLFDLHSRRLPNTLMALGLATALTGHLLSAALGLGSASPVGTGAVAPLTLGAGAGLLMLTAGIALWRIGLFGAGDAKLLAVSAAHFTPSVVPALLLHSLLVGGACALLWWGLHRLPLRASTPGSARRSASTHSVPYALAIAGGCALTLATGGSLVGNVPSPDPGPARALSSPLPPSETPTPP